MTAPPSRAPRLWLFCKYHLVLEGVFEGGGGQGHLRDSRLSFVRQLWPSHFHSFPVNHLSILVSYCVLRPVFFRDQYLQIAIVF